MLTLSVIQDVHNIGLGIKKRKKAKFKKINFGHFGTLQSPKMVKNRQLKKMMTYRSAIIGGTASRELGIERNEI